MSRLFALVLCGLLAAGCGAETAGRSPEAGPADTVAYLDPGSEFPRLLYDHGVASLNDRCPVRRAKLNPKVPPTFVNGRPIGFC